MRRKVLVLGLVALALAGCSSSKGEDEEQMTQAQRERQFAREVRSAYPDEFRGATTQEMAAIGVSVCDLLDAGGDHRHILLGMSQVPGVTPGMAGTIAGSAVRNLCPEHTDRMEEQLESFR